MLLSFFMSFFIVFFFLCITFISQRDGRAARKKQSRSASRMGPPEKRVCFFFPGTRFLPGDVSRGRAKQSSFLFRQ